MAKDINKLEQMLRNSPDLLAGIIASAMDAIIVTDDAQRIVLFNAAAERMLACPADEAIGASIDRFIPQRFRAEHSRHVRHFGESGVTNRNSSTLGILWGLRPTGEEVPIEAAISKVEVGGRKFFGVVIRDVTERHRAEEALRESEERHRHLVESANDWVWEVDVNVVYTYVGPQCRKILGYEAEEIIGKTPFDLMPPEEARRVAAVFTPIAAERKPFRGLENINRHKDGHLVSLETNGVPVINREGEFLGYRGMDRDITERKRMEESLRKSEERFRLAAQAEKMYAYEWDVATDVIVRSGDAPGVLRSTGEAPLTRQQLLAGVHPDDRPSFNASVSERTPENPETQIIYRVLRPDGSIVWLEKTGRAYFDEHGRMVRMIGMVADITERKRAEDAIREGDLRYRRIIETTNEGVWLLDTKLHTSYVNRQMAEMLGYEPGEMVGRSVFEFYFPEDVERKKQVLRKRQQGRREQLDERVRRKDGSELWVRMAATPVFKDNGDFDGALAMMNCITERKAAEEALRESEERFRLVANNAPVMIWMSGLDTKPTYFNQPWLDFTGLSETDLQNGLAEIVHPEDYQHCRDVYCRGFDQRQPFRKECRLRRHDGQYRWMLDIGVPRFHKDGSFAGYIGSCIDVTDNKLAEDALTNMSRKLIEAQEQERARIARELHDDISQRLAMLAIDLEQLKENPSEFGNSVQELRKRTTEISNDVQALSHDLHSSQLEYLGVVAGMKSWCKEFGERQGMQIDCRHDVRSTLPPEIGLCLFRVLQEALHNAAKHSGVRRIEVQTHEESDEIHLIVSDSGRGFDVEAVKQGNGLGLTSMRERVRLVNGTISIESKPMGGTVIHVRVPFKSEHVSERAAV
jgi:PAS domain S-box-containing protein